jgi:hypothetical protein
MSSPNFPSVNISQRSPNLLTILSRSPMIVRYPPFQRDPSDILQTLLHIITSFESSRQPTLHHVLNLCIRTSTASRTTNGKFAATGAFPESSSSLTLSLSVSQSYNARPHLVNSSFGAFPRFLSMFIDPDAMPCNRWAGVVGGVFVCASWALRATDRMITVVIGPDDTDSIAPTPDSPRSLRRKWTGTALRARPGSALYRSTSWADSAGGGSSPYGSTYSGSSHAGSPSAGSPMLSYSPYSPAAPSPLSGRTPSSSAGFAVPGSASGLGLPPNLFGPGPPPSSRIPAPAMAGTLGSPVPGPSTPPYSPFPPTPRSSLSGFAALPSLSDSAKKDD